MGGTFLFLRGSGGGVVGHSANSPATNKAKSCAFKTKSENIFFFFLEGGGGVFGKKSKR